MQQCAVNTKLCGKLRKMRNWAIPHPPHRNVAPEYGFIVYLGSIISWQFHQSNLFSRSFYCNFFSDTFFFFFTLRFYYFDSSSFKNCSTTEDRNSSCKSKQLTRCFTEAEEAISRIKEAISKIKAQQWTPPLYQLTTKVTHIYIASIHNHILRWHAIIARQYKAHLASLYYLYYYFK